MKLRRSTFKTIEKPGTIKCARSRCKTCPFVQNAKISGPKRFVKITDRFRLRQHLRDVEKDVKDASKPVARHFNLPNHSKEHMSICRLSLHPYHRQPQKSGAKIHFSNRHPQSPRHQRTLFIQLIYSCFLRDQVPTNSVAPSSVYKAYTTLNSSICSDEGLTLETSAFQSLYGGQFTLSTPLINQMFHSPTDAAPQFLQKLTPFMCLDFFLNALSYMALHGVATSIECAVRMRRNN